jgi:ribosomal-protein-alanine N-acetyltransferase
MCGKRPIPGNSPGVPSLPSAEKNSSVVIVPPTAGDADEFVAAVARSRALHADWVAPPATVDAFESYLQRSSRPDFAAFLIRLFTDGGQAGSIAGAIHVSNIVGEPLSSAYLGFYAFEPHARQGHMLAGLKLVLGRAFGELGLHRVEANIQPTNAASLALVRACGFRREGFSPKYLRIAGEWRDHERWALLAEELERCDPTSISRTIVCRPNVGRV